MGHLSDFGTAALAHPDAAGLYEMWTALRGDRPAPFRAELDAAKIGARAPYLAILEYVGPSNFRVRIAGDRLNKWFGIELRGMSALSMIEPEARNHFQSALNRLTAEPAVAAVRGRARRPDGFSAHFEMVLLPMRSDFGRIDRVLVGLWLIDAPALTPGPMRLDATEFVVTPVFAEDAAQNGSGHRAETPDEGDETLAEAPAAPDRGEAPVAETAGGEPDGGAQSASGGRPAEGRAERHAEQPEIRRGHLRLIKGGGSLH